MHTYTKKAPILPSEKILSMSTYGHKIVKSFSALPYNIRSPSRLSTFFIKTLNPDFFLWKITPVMFL